MPHPSYIGRSLAVLNSAMLSRRGTRLGSPSSLGEKSKATKASNEWSAYFAGCLVVPDDGKGATFKMAGRRVAILRAIRSFWRVSSNKANQSQPDGQPEQRYVEGGSMIHSAHHFFPCSYLP